MPSPHESKTETETALRDSMQTSKEKTNEKNSADYIGAENDGIGSATSSTSSVSINKDDWMWHQLREDDDSSGDDNHDNKDLEGDFL